MDPEGLTNPSIYQAQAVMDNLYVSIELPVKVQRAMTRSWTKIKTGK